MQFDEFIDFLTEDDDDEEENDGGFTLEPVFRDGEVVAVLQISHCSDCEETYVENIFTDGSCPAIEDMLEDLGYR